MCLGALFLPDDGPANTQLEAIKDKYRQFAAGHSFSDAKYARSGDKFTSAVCQEIIDLFNNQTAWFRALVIDTSSQGFSWSYFGGYGAPRNLTKARAYSRLTELLLERNLRGIEDAVLLADSMTEVAGDNFIEYMTERFGFTRDLTGLDSLLPPIRSVQRVDTGLPDYQLGQMCDVLLGIITGDLTPPTNPNKLSLIQHGKDVLGIPGFGPDYWLGVPETIRGPCIQVPCMALTGKIKGPSFHPSLAPAFSGRLWMGRRLQVNFTIRGRHCQLPLASQLPSRRRLPTPAGAPPLPSCAGRRGFCSPARFSCGGGGSRPLGR